MFAILDSNKMVNHDSVYHAIVFTISLLVDEKTSYTSFRCVNNCVPLFMSFIFYSRPVLDVYIQNHVKSIRAHAHLIACLKAIFEKIHNPQSFKAVMPTLKVTTYF